MKADEIQAERESDYGDAKESHQAIADSWSVYLSRRFRNKITLEPKDVAILMVLFKAMREAHKHKYDNLLDLASYGDIARQFHEDTIQNIQTPDTEDRSCKDCYFRSTEISREPCKSCYEIGCHSKWVPNNIPSEVPFDREPKGD